MATSTLTGGIQTSAKTGNTMTPVTNQPAPLTPVKATEQPVITPPPAPTAPIVQSSTLAQNMQSDTKGFLDWANANLDAQTAAVAQKLLNTDEKNRTAEEANRLYQLELQKSKNDTKKTNALAGTSGTDTPTGDTTGVKGAGYWTYSGGKKKWVSTDGSNSGMSGQSSIDQENQDALDNFQKMTDKMLHGTFPLNPLQQAQLDAMRGQFEALIDAQKEANKQYEGSIQQAGLTGGRSRYAPEIMAGEVLNSVNVGIKKVAELDSKMTSALAQMQAGFQEANYTLVEKSYKAFTDAQKVKQDNLDKISEQIAEALKQTNEANQKEQESISDVLKSAVGAGASLEVQNAIRNATSLNDAIAAAGDYLAPTTGIVGEYALYKRQAIAAGQTPMDFNSYQTMDANRKARAAGVGSSLYTPQQEKIIERIDRTVSGSAAYTATQSMQTFVNNTLSALSQETGVGDIAAINQFQKVIDAGAVTRDQDVKLIQGAQSLADTLTMKINKLREGDQLSPELRAEMKQTVTDIYNAQLQAIGKDPFINAKKKELQRNGIDENDTIFGQLTGLQANTGSEIIQSEAKAEATLKGYLARFPDKQNDIANNIKIMEQQLGRSVSSSEFLEAFPEYK